MSYDSLHQQIQGFLFNGSLYICHEKHARHGNCGFDIFGKHSFREGSTAKRQKKTLLTQYLCKGVMHAIYHRGKYVFFVCYVISYKKMFCAKCMHGWTINDIQFTIIQHPILWNLGVILSMSTGTFVQHSTLILLSIRHYERNRFYECLVLRSVWRRVMLLSFAQKYRHGNIYTIGTYSVYIV